MTRRDTSAPKNEGSQSANSRERCNVKCVKDGSLAEEAVQCIGVQEQQLRDHTGVKVFYFVPPRCGGNVTV